MSGTPSEDQDVSFFRVFARSLVEESTVLLVRLAIVAVCGVLGYLVGGAAGMWLGLLLGVVLAGVAWLVLVGWALSRVRKARREAQLAAARGPAQR